MVFCLCCQNSYVGEKSITELHQVCGSISECKYFIYQIWLWFCCLGDKRHNYSKTQVYKKINGKDKGKDKSILENNFIFNSTYLENTDIFLKSIEHYFSQTPSRIFKRHKKVRLCNVMDVNPWNGRGVWGFAWGLSFGGCILVLVWFGGFWFGRAG